MSKPTLYVVAGANGSGKSTLINKHRNLIKDANPLEVPTFISGQDLEVAISQNKPLKDI